MKPKIYIFSIFHWDSNLLHREHMLAKSFDKLGYEVCFVERSNRKIIGKRSRMVGSIEVLTIFALPYAKGYLHSIFMLNDWIIRQQLSKDLDATVKSWFILSSPLWAKTVSSIVTPKQKLIYDISDDHLNFATNDTWRKNLKKYEDFAIEKADFVSLTSENLLTKLPVGKKHAIIENGVDLTSSAAARPVLRDKFKGKIVGFIGGIYKRVDLDLIATCANTYPKAEFVIIGLTDQENKLRELELIPNCHYLGPISWDKIQDYFASLDVGIIPFVSEAEYPWLKTVDSVKVYQYAYFGYPIVVTKFGQVEKLEPMVSVAGTKAEFVSLVSAALDQEEPKTLVDRRIELAKKHDWVVMTERLTKSMIE